MIYEVRSRTGAAMPNLGLGTWRMGEELTSRKEEVNALRLGVDLGMGLIDTAEMYADGGAERVVAEAIEGHRAEVVLVSKVLPHNASFQGTIRACEGSLRRLRTDRIDLYLLHWPGPHPVAETVRAFERLLRDGKILHWGISNFDVEEMEEVVKAPGGRALAANQVLFNLERRGVERRLLPACRDRGVVPMAYSPFEQGRLAHREGLMRAAHRHGVSPSQMALAWVLSREEVVAIPKASQSRHVRENAEAAQLVLTDEDLADLDRDYPVPERDEPLATL